MKLLVSMLGGFQTQRPPFVSPCADEFPAPPRVQIISLKTFSVFDPLDPSSRKMPKYRLIYQFEVP
jgi:hypothetical protein